jgi:EAL domain-containing protein (putative c-di-GMP-specific phosphodiesterase class I)/FixJ family two-component response regulator
MARPERQMLDPDLALSCSSNGHDGPVAMESRRALIFDDNPNICTLAVTRLTQLGFEARSVTEKTAFVTAVESSDPELILLDLSLGDTDAVELFGFLNEQNFRGQVILMSGHSGAVLEHARRLGELSGIAIAGVLEKPFHQRDLRALIANLDVAAIRRPVPQRDQANPDLLRHALANDWLEFWYQPKIELKTDCIVGAECLARIRHPEQGILTPATFLKHASDQDLNELTMRALDVALRSSIALDRLGRPLILSINVAARTFVRPGLINDIISIRERHSTNLPIILEMTESDLINDKAAAAAFATRAILHGFQIAIDDFGNGYATFDRLRDMPFTELKIERSMVNGCAHDPALRSICKAAVHLAQGFGVKVIAEGVEQIEDLQVIRSLGFDMAQGYIFSRPLPFQDFLQLPAAFSIRPSLVKDAAVRR